MTTPSPTPPRQSPTTASAADVLGPQEVLAIQEQGHSAGYTGESPSTCPWASATEPAELARRDMWIRGYAAGKTDRRITQQTTPAQRQSPA